jgi:fumarate hydratase class II
LPSADVACRDWRIAHRPRDQYCLVFHNLEEPILAKTRVERDSLGELHVPEDALYGAQTQRAIDNFHISDLRMPLDFIRALGLVKSCAAAVNADLGLLDREISRAVCSAADEIAAGAHYEQFPLDVFQTGSGTSTNMNANEVIARLASQRSGIAVHPNDHVNHGQSSNDVIPTVIHVCSCRAITDRLLPVLDGLQLTLGRRADELSGIVKTGRTHLMDAMPIRFDQELGAWRTQMIKGVQRIRSGLDRLAQLALGGTAVGTGVNSHPQFGPRVTALLARKTGVPFVSARDYFEGISTQDAAVEMSGQLRTLAVSLMKMSNDLRWMNSGPLAGLAEITLPVLQPGSSIMPGKVNPVVPEAVAMACAQVIGNDTTIVIAGQSGNFQLNVMLPVIAYNLLQSVGLLANAARALDEKAIAGFTVNTAALSRSLRFNPVLVTSLNDVIGYDRGAEIAKRAYAEGRPVLDVAEEMTDLSRSELERLLDPATLTGKTDAG